MTRKQRALVKGVANGKSVHQAALAAGYAPTTAKSDPYKSGRLRQALAALMDEMGLGERELLIAIRDALRAHRRGRTPDHPVRLKAAETGLRLRGHFGKDDPEGPHEGPVVKIQFNVIPSANAQGPDGPGNGRVLDGLSFQRAPASPDDPE